MRPHRGFFDDLFDIVTAILFWGGMVCAVIAIGWMLVS